MSIQASLSRTVWASLTWLSLGLAGPSLHAQNEAFLRPIDSLGQDLAFSCADPISLDATFLEPAGAWVSFIADETGTLTLAQLPISLDESQTAAPQLRLRIRENLVTTITLPVPPFDEVTIEGLGELITESDPLNIPVVAPGACPPLMTVHLDETPVQAGEKYWVGFEISTFQGQTASVRWHTNMVGVNGWYEGPIATAFQPGTAPAVSLFGVTPGLIDPQPCPVVIPHPDPSADDSSPLGEAVVLQGSRMVAGGGDSQNPGRVFVFEEVGGTWTMSQELVAAAPADGDRFGRRLAMKDDLIVVGHGAFGASPELTTFERNAGGWVRTDNFVLEDSSFGALALEADRIAVGKPGGVVPGAVEIFRRQTSGQWVLETTLSPDMAGAEAIDGNESFGVALAMQGGRLAVSSPSRTVDSVEESGRIVIFERAGVSWTPVAALTDETGEEDQRLGQSIYLEGDRLTASVATDNAGVVFDLRVPGDQQSPAERFEAPVTSFFGFLLDDSLLGYGFGLSAGSIFYRSGGSWFPDQSYTDCPLILDLPFAKSTSLSEGRAALGNPSPFTPKGGEILLLDYRDTITKRFRDAGPALSGPGLVPPRLTGSALYYPGTPVQVELSEAAASAPVLLVLGFSRIDTPFKLGTLVPFPDVSRMFSTDALGGLSLQDSWPNGMPLDTEIFAQFWISDATGPVGVTASNAVRIQSF